MHIHANFIGGNIFVKDVTDHTVLLENQLRDTHRDWFYWAFCVEGAENQTLTFQMEPCRLGYFGPAVSHDLVHWRWLDRVEGDSFTYHFSAEEHQVYFAHSMLYHPERFFAFAEKNGLTVETLCTGYKGSPVPCVTLGNGSKSVILTARHHACESTGNYVLEGMLEELLRHPLPDTTVFCVPFVDYEGVIRGDQGKSREPHDHNRDYTSGTESLYPECAAIRDYAREKGCHYGFDFHSPWHKGGEHDHVYILRNRADRLAQFDVFSALLEQAITEDSLAYHAKNDYPPDTAWNQYGPQFGCYMSELPENELAFTLETTYFGTPDNKVDEDRMLALGRCFARAVSAYMAQIP